MRILIHDYAGHPFQIQLSRKLALRGHTVLHAYAGQLQTPRGSLVRTRSDPASFDFEEVAMDAKYAEKKYSFVSRRAMEIRYGLAAGRLVQSWKPDVVLSGNTPTESQTNILRAAKLAGSKFVYWVQDFYSLAVDQLARQKIPVLGAAVGAWYKHLDRSHFSQSDALVIITDDFRPILATRFGVDPKSVHTIPNWGPLEDVPVLDKANDWSRREDLVDKFCFLYTGTLGMKHNPELLLGLAQHFENDSLVRVVVVSEGIGAQWLEDQIRTSRIKNLLLYPYQSFEQLPAVLATGDVLVAVLEKEAGIFSVPSKVLTYLCAARPLLVAVPSENLVARLVEQTDAGRVAEPVDFHGFLQAASDLRSDDKGRSAMASNGRAYAENTFAIETVASDFEKVFESILGRQ